MLRSGSLKLLIMALLVGVPGGLSAEEQPLGQPSQGLQASLSSSQDVYERAEDIVLTLTVTNVSDAPITIDPWVGNWFVQVWNERWNLMPNIRAGDVFRVPPKPITLQPQEQWETTVNGLKLVAGLEGSTPLWEYEPLPAGEYWIGAEYVTYGPDSADYWVGGINCALIKIKITSDANT